MSIKNDNEFAQVFDKYTNIIIKNNHEYINGKISNEHVLSETKEAILEVIEYIDKYVEEKLEDQRETITINAINNYLGS
jgi:small nuclear ribonucleoprotein (snRNP)-like protein